jgi:hypothetical protein
LKELFSAFSAAVFYPLVSLVLPGLSALSAWFLFLMNWPVFRSLASRNHTESAFVLMLLSIFIGTIIDDLGMRIESYWLDRRRNRKTNGTHVEEWWKYLRKPFDVEPAGSRHLRKLVARLKFELGIPIGLTLTNPAVWLNSAITYRLAIGITVIAISLIVYLLLEAAATHEVLGTLRHELLKDDGEAFVVARPKKVQSA